MSPIWVSGCFRYRCPDENDMGVRFGAIFAVKHYFKKYRDDPYEYSQELQNLGGLDLQGYRKTYIANATYRIVFKIEEDIVKIVEVVAVGKRADKQVYKDAYNRIK